MYNSSKLLASLVLGLALAAGYAAPSQAADGETCVSPRFTNNWLVTGGNDSTESVLAAIPAGEVRIPRAESTDSYPNRVNVVQLSERWEVQFLAADGAVLATSVATGDVPDRVENGYWSGSLPAVTVPDGVTRVRVVHRDDLPADGSPNSLHVTGLTLCWDDPVPPVSTTTTPAAATTAAPPSVIDPVTTLAPQPAGPVATLDTDSNAQDTTTSRPQSTGPSLPLTGAETAGVIGLAILLMAGGLGLLLVARRGNRAS